MRRNKKSQNPVPERYQKNCIIYTRISDPNKQTEVSISAQTRECRAFAEKFGLNVIDVVSDYGTGTNIDRPGFYSLQQRARKQDFRYLLVWRYDRFSRSQQDTYAAIGYFGRFGINIVPIKEQESLEPTSQEKLMAGIYIAMAEYYSAELSIKVCRNMYEMAKSGMYLGGSTPLGYKVVNKRLEIDEDAAYVIREAFQMYADGKTTRQLCERFNAEGYKTSTGKAFNENSFRAILSNEKYIGVYSYNATDPDGNPVPIRIEGKIPALIDEALFQRVQERLRQTSRGPGTAKAKVPYLLKDKIYCGLCGESMRSDSNKKANGEVYRYYNCRKDRKGYQCKRKTMPKEVIERNVAAQTILLLCDQDYVKGMTAVLNKLHQSGGNSEELRELKKKFNDIKRKFDAIFNKILEADTGEVTMAEYIRKAYEEKLSEVSAEKERLEARIEKLKAVYQPKELTPFDIDDWFSELRTYNLNSFDDRQHIISKYVKQVIVYDDYMEVLLYEPGEITDIQDADTTLACAKTYIDFRDESIDIEIPDYLKLSENDSKAAMQELLNNTDGSNDNDDDDPDPKGPGGGSPGTPPSGGGTTSRKSTRPYNTKSPDTVKNSGKGERSSLAQVGEPLIFKAETA